MDIAELIGADEVAWRLGLGPYGALLYCMEYLSANLAWHILELELAADMYVALDCPG